MVFTGCYIGASATSTRGVFAGGWDSSSYLNTIQYVTIATTGNTSDFGDMTLAQASLGAVSSPTRIVFSAGQPNSPYAEQNVINYITVATAGNAVDFGDMSAARYNIDGGASDCTRGCWGGGWTKNPETSNDTIDYITISSIGNATDFGNLLEANSWTAGVSNCHGGLG